MLACTAAAGRNGAEAAVAGWLLAADAIGCPGAAMDAADPAF